MDEDANACGGVLFLRDGGERASVRARGAGVQSRCVVAEGAAEQLDYRAGGRANGGPRESHLGAATSGFGYGGRAGRGANSSPVGMLHSGTAGARIRRGRQTP